MCLFVGDLVPFDLAPIVQELDLIQHIGILKQALLEAHNNKLAVLEVLLDHQPDVLRVVQVQGRVDLVQDVQWGRLVPQQRQDQRQRQQTPLPARQLRQALLPLIVEADLQLQSLLDAGLLVRERQLGLGVGEQGREDLPAVLGDDFPGDLELVVHLLIHILDRFQQLIPILLNGVLLSKQLRVPIIQLIEHRVDLEVDSLLLLLNFLIKLLDLHGQLTDV